MRRIINMRALLVIALGFIFGILFGKFNIVYGLEIFIIFPAALLIVTLAFSLVFRKEKAYVAGLSLVSLMLCVCFICGYILFDSAAVRYEKAAIEENRYTVAGRVESFREYDNYLSVTLDGVSFTDGDRVIESDYKIRVYAYYDDVYEFDIGSLVTFSAKVKNYSSFYNGDFSDNLVLDKIKYNCYVNLSAVKTVGFEPGFFQTVNLAVRDKLKEGMSEEEFGISYALLTGNSGYIGYETLEKFRAGGIAHIFAVSGLHIGFLSAALFFVLKKFNRRLLKFIIITAVLFFYAGICGFTPSCVRAAIMCGVCITADMTGKKYDLLNSLLFSAIILLIVSPMYLFDVGFILSYTCVLSIVVLAPVVKRALKFLPEKLNSSLSVILAVQIGVFPLNLTFFNHASLLSVLLNFIMIPLVSVVFTLLLIALLLSFVIPFETTIFAFPAFMIKLVRLFVTAFEWKLLSVSDVKMGNYIMAYYCMLILCSYHVNLSKKVRVTMIAVMLALLIIGLVKLNAVDSGQVYVKLQEMCYNNRIQFTDEC